MHQLFYFSTENVFNAVPTKLHNISQSSIEQAKEKYDEMCEDFIDTVFVHEPRLKRNEWEGLVVKNVSYVLNPKDIRDKLGYKTS